jgi:hypothetical protein
MVNERIQFYRYMHFSLFRTGAADADRYAHDQNDEIV